jgi:hypothetical protein
MGVTCNSKKSIIEDKEPKCLIPPIENGDVWVIILSNANSILQMKHWA